MDPLAHFPIFPDQLASPSPSPPSSINFVTSLPHHFELLKLNEVLKRVDGIRQVLANVPNIKKNPNIWSGLYIFD
ncbi:hypothetical protein BLOT_012244 [Blomia tropicalis]|nr:hypothetical protein BLOT_012244 [Blomia tropicalis]